MSVPRHEGREVDHELAQNDAKTLYKAGEKKLGTDDKTFIRIFSERSAAQLAAINSAYHSLYGKSLKKVGFLHILCLFSFLNSSSFFFFVAKFKCNFYQAVKGETSGHFKHALLAILQCSENPAMYFAKVLISFQVLTSFSTCKILNSFLFNSTSTLDMNKLNVQFKINFAGAAQGNERSGN